MRPFKGGGDMIRTVAKDEITYNDGPMRFEAGTPNIVQMIGLGAAIDYLQGLGMENIAAHEHSLRDYARDKLEGINWLQVYGKSAGKGCDIRIQPGWRCACPRCVDHCRPKGRCPCAPATTARNR